jgi:hypothetical protein
MVAKDRKRTASPLQRAAMAVRRKKIRKLISMIEKCFA